MKTNHTPGPWHTDSSCRGIIENTGIRIAEVYDRGTETPSSEANARLIAAAPELLDALEWLVVFFDKYPPHFSDGKSMSVDLNDMQDAREAIAKATGK